MLTHALAYAGRGWAVLPVYALRNEACTCRTVHCRSAGKHPRLRKWVERASSDPAIIRGWWKRWPDGSIGIATGPLSSLVVLDVDANKGGFDTLNALQNECGKLPVTLSQATGGGGRHYLFSWPEIAIRSNAETLGSGLDIRGRGGFIVAPPSPHISGSVYAWEADFNTAQVAPFPQFLIDKLCDKRDKNPDCASGEVGEGERNSFLTSLGGTLRREGKSRQEIKMQLAEANAIKCHPALTPEEVDLIAESVSRYRMGPGPSNPRFQYRDWLKSPAGPDNHTTCHILHMLTGWMDKHGRKCFPNIDDIAAVSKCSVKTVGRHLEEAARMGWIGRYSHKGSSSGWKSYGYFVPPKLFDQLADNESPTTGQDDRLIDH